MATIIFVAVLAAILGGLGGWAICYLYGRPLPNIAAKLAGVVQSAIDTRRAQQEYEAEIKRLKAETEQLRSERKELQAARQPLSKELQAATSEEQSSRFDFMQASAIVQQDREKTPLPKKATLRQRFNACEASLATYKGYWEAADTRINALIRKDRASEKLIMWHKHQARNLTESLQLETERADLSEARVKVLRKRKVRWGPGFAVGISSRDGQIAPSASVGIAVIWGR